MPSDNEEIRLVQLNMAQGQFEACWSFLETMSIVCDAFCLQEVLQKDHQRLEVLFSSAYWVPMTRVQVDGVWSEVGLGVYSNHRMLSRAAYHYVGTPQKLKNLDAITLDSIHETENHILLAVELECRGVVYTIGTTHFTWVPVGLPSCYQRDDARVLLKLIREVGEIILLGDFNFPRGGEIYRLLADELHDCLPPEIETTLDPMLHKLKGSVRVVTDYIFSIGKYCVDDVTCVFGVSDHAALAASVRRV